MKKGCIPMRRPKAILVVGLLEFDSGKTSVATSLVREAREEGLDAVAAKPVGAHNAWNQYGSLIRSEKLGMLLGDDAYRLWLASEKSEPPELLSPLDVLSSPPDPCALSDLSTYLSAITNLLRMAVMIRISKASGRGVNICHYVIPDNLERTLPLLRRRVKKLASVLRAEPLESEELVNIMYSSIKHVDTILSELASRHELLIIESFNNAAYPTPFSLEAYKVILVTPGRAYVYEGREYARRASALSSLNKAGVTTYEVIRDLEPIATVSLIPRPRSKLGIPMDDTRHLLKLVTE